MLDIIPKNADDAEELARKTKISDILKIYYNITKYHSAAVLHTHLGIGKEPIMDKLYSTYKKYNELYPELIGLLKPEEGPAPKFTFIPAWEYDKYK